MKKEFYSEHTLLLTNCGREDCSDLHSWGPGIRPCYIIHYVIKGAGWLEYGKNVSISRQARAFSYILIPSCAITPIRNSHGSIPGWISWAKMRPNCYPIPGFLLSAPYPRPSARSRSCRFTNASAAWISSITTKERPADFLWRF